MPPTPRSSSRHGSKAGGPVTRPPVRGPGAHRRIRESRGQVSADARPSGRAEAGAHRIRLSSLRGTIAGGSFAVDELAGSKAACSAAANFPRCRPRRCSRSPAPRLAFRRRWRGTMVVRRDASHHRDLVALARWRRPRAGRRARTRTRPYARRACRRIRRRPRARNARCTLAPGRRRRDRRSCAVSAAGGRFGADAPLTLSARVNAASLRALQGVADYRGRRRASGASTSPAMARWTACDFPARSKAMRSSWKRHSTASR